jgi:GNAT superfamily N-acetyltransferase
VTDALDLTVRPLREDDIPPVVQLLQDTFGTWPSVQTSAAPIDHLRWKLGDGRPGDSYHFVAEIDGRIVAFQLNHLWRVKVGDKELRVLRGGDSAVHPDYQGRGVMSIMRPAMNPYFEDVSDFFLGGSDHPATPRLHARGNEDRRDFGHRWLVFVQPLTLRAALRTFKLRPGRSPRKLATSIATFARWMRIDRSAPRLEPAWCVRTVDRFDDRVDALCHDAAREFDFIIMRNAALLNWRYADRRGGDFTIRLAEEGDRLLGYSVLRTTRGTGHIADLLALPGRLDVADSLARDAGAQLRGRASVIECWLFENHPYVPALRSCGFLGRRRRRQLTYEAVAVPLSEIEMLSKKSMVGHLTLGDIDII